MKALVIEDEVLALKHLIKVLDSIDEIDVIDTLESILDTIAWFGRNPQPDIVFMDIHLADGLAFEVFRHVNITCPIIFTTAYDEYALKAFKVNSVDYLLKPIEADDVRIALKKLEELSASGTMHAAINSIINTFNKSPKYKRNFLVPVKGDKLIPLQTADLACIYIDTGTVRALTFEGKSCCLDFTLDELSEMLDPECFFRANRQYILSKKAIKDIDLWFNSRLSVNLNVSVPDKIVISRNRIPEFKAWFSGQ